MSQKIIFGSLLCLGFAVAAKAADTDSLRAAYRQIPSQYVEEISVEEVAIKALKGLVGVDSKVRVGDDFDKVSVYANGRLLKAMRKPQDKNSVEEWVEISQVLMDEAAKKSAKAGQYDFEMIDAMMKNAAAEMDGDSKYYSSLGDLKADRIKHQRFFGSRKEGDVLVLKIVAFNNHTIEEIEKAVKEAGEFQGVIIDLRGSPGGMLGEAIKTADLFLDEGIVVASRGRQEDTTVYYSAHDGDITQGKKIIVLVDEKTASAAEVLASALQEQGRAKVVGTKTFGKGSIQSLVNLPNGGVFSVTNAYFYTPSGRKLNKQGILPDICTFEMPEGKNIDNLIALGKIADCKGESREDTELELKIAKKLLEM